MFSACPAAIEYAGSPGSTQLADVARIISSQQMPPCNEMGPGNAGHITKVRVASYANGYREWPLVYVARRAASFSSTASRWLPENSVHPAISSRVLKQPMHSGAPGSIRHTFTQGLQIGRSSFIVLPDCPNPSVSGDRQRPSPNRWNTGNRARFLARCPGSPHTNNVPPLPAGRIQRQPRTPSSF
jgi:hypothetical protein